MDEILAYLKNCGTFYLATTEGDQPRVRPFGAVCAFEGKLYICTNNRKKVYHQMLENPKVEISAADKGSWLRLSAEGGSRPPPRGSRGDASGVRRFSHRHVRAG